MPAIIAIGAPKGGDDPPPLNSPGDESSPLEEKSEPQGDCDDCKFYNASQGYCARYPPNSAGWPPVQPDEWCGEFQSGPQHKSEGEAPPDDQSPAPGGGDYLGSSAPGARSQGNQ